MNSLSKNLKRVHKGRGRSRRGGFTLAEVMLSLVILAMMTVMFGAVFPITMRAATQGNSYSQAALLAQRKVDQLRQAQYGSLYDNVNGTALTKLSQLGIVDPAQNSDGSYSFTTVDHLTGPGGFYSSDSVGKITITDYSADTTPSNSGLLPPSAGQVAVATVTVTWGGKVPGTYTVSALIPAMTHS